MTEWPLRPIGGEIRNRPEYELTDSVRLQTLSYHAIDRIEAFISSEHNSDVARVSSNFLSGTALQQMHIMHRAPAATEEVIFSDGRDIRKLSFDTPSVLTEATLQVLHPTNGVQRDKGWISVRQRLAGSSGIFVNTFLVETFSGGSVQNTIAHIVPMDAIALEERCMTPYDFGQLHKLLGELAIMAGAVDFEQDGVREEA